MIKNDLEDVDLKHDFIFPHNKAPSIHEKPSYEECKFDQLKHTLHDTLNTFWNEVSHENNEEIHPSQIPHEKYKTLCLQCMTYLWLFTFTLLFSFNVTTI